MRLRLRYLSAVLAGCLFGGAVGAEPAPPKAGEEATDDAAAQALLERSVRKVLPGSPEQIRAFRNAYKSVERAAQIEAPPAVRSRTIQMRVGPDQKSPVIHISPRYTTTVTILDATGQPWPIAHIAPGNPELLPVSRPEGLKPGNRLDMVALRRHAYGNVGISLEGLTQSINLLLQADVKRSDNPVVIRLDRPGPLASASLPPSLVEPVVSDEMQGFLNRVPPAGAKKVGLSGDMPGEVDVWRFRGRLWIRTFRHLKWPAADSVASESGIFVYRIPDVPLINLSRDGVVAKIKIEG